MPQEEQLTGFGQVCKLSRERAYDSIPRFSRRVATVS